MASVLRRITLAVLCAKVALIPLVFDPFALNVFAQPKALLNNAFDLLLIGLLVATALGHRRSMLRWSPLHLPVLVFGAAYLAAAVFALDHRVAAFGTPDRQLGLIAALDNTLLYVAVVTLARTRTDVLWLGASVAAATLGVLGYELLQWSGFDPVPWARPSRDVLPATLGNRGVVAQYLGTVAMAAIGLAIVPSLLHRKVRAVVIGLALFALAGALMSGARAVFIGLALGGVTLPAYHAFRAATRRALVLRLAASAVLALVVVALALTTPAGRRLEALLQDPGSIVTTDGSEATEGSVASRLDLYRIAALMVRDRPVLGVGPDNYAVAFPAYRTPESNRAHDFVTTQTSTHSWVAKVATDSGVLGLVAFVAAVGVALVLGFRERARPWSLASSAALMSFLGTGLVSVNHIGTDWLPWLAFALLAAPVAATDPASPQPEPKRRGRHRRSGSRRRALLLAGAALTAGVALVWITVKDPLQASHYAKESRQALAAGEGWRAAAIAAAQRAVSLDPGRAEYWNDLGLGHLRADDPVRAARAFSAAAQLAPYQFIYLTNLARAQLSLGLRGDQDARAAALATARRAQEVDRYVPEVQYVLALSAGADGSDKETAGAAELFLMLGGGADAIITEATAGAYLAVGRPVDAERWLRLVVHGDEPDQPRLRTLLARALLAQDRVVEALRQLDLVLAVEPQNEAALRLRARISK